MTTPELHGNAMEGYDPEDAMTTPTYKGHAKGCAMFIPGSSLQCNCGMTTPTPRTDAAAVNAHDGLPVTRVSADFARQLERDLAAAQEELERVRDKCNEHYMALAVAQEANEQLSDALKAWEGEHCGGDCLAEPCSMCDGTRHRQGKGERMQEQIDELRDQLTAAQEALANLRKEYQNSIEAWTGIEDEKNAAEALAEKYKALLIEAQRECHEDNGLMARIDAAREGK